MGTMKQNTEVSVTEERQEMPALLSSSGIVRIILPAFISGFLKKSVLLVWSFCYPVSGGCAAPPVP